MDKEKLIEYVENSFLASLISDKDITDISYNGADIYYVSNSIGRQKSDIHVDQKTVRDFLRQISNLAEQQFSFTNPNLDVSFGLYRINATHQSIGKLNDNDVCTFSIRIASEKLKINDKSDFLTPEIVELLNYIISARLSIVIGGLTGSGKTELQKYIISKMRKNERVIVIDNVMELDHLRKYIDIDLTCWKVDDKNVESSAPILIKNALRNNPDWLILAEARDKEMLDVLNSSMTGAPIITTVHSLDAHSIPSRMARLVLRNEQKLDYNEVLNDIYYHFHFYIYVKKDDSDGVINRYISEIYYIDNEGKCYQLFNRDKSKTKFFKLPDSAIELLKINKETTMPFKKKFLGGTTNE